VQSDSVIIVGAGGFGREVALAAQMCPSPISVAGFLDDRAQGPATAEGWPILGTLDQGRAAMNCVIAVGAPRTRRLLAARLQQFSPRFARIDVEGRRHPTVEIASGAMVVAGVRTTVTTSIGAHFIGNLNCTIGHDVRIGDFVTLAPLVAVSGSVQIGSGVEIGTGACIREGLRIGEGAMVGMGAVVVKDVEPNTVVVGNPARQVKDLPPW
jgi:sugar O-acyltransferase (sialic acid O-acetyltransferase NeuD family)